MSSAQSHAKTLRSYRVTVNGGFKAVAILFADTVKENESRWELTRAGNFVGHIWKDSGAQLESTEAWFKRVKQTVEETQTLSPEGTKQNGGTL